MDQIAPITTLEQLYAALIAARTSNDKARLAVINWAANTNNPAELFQALSDHLYSHLDINS